MRKIEQVKNTILLGNSVKTLSEIEPESIDCSISSPPYYAQRNYGTGFDFTWDNNNGCDHEFEGTVEENIPVYQKQDYDASPRQQGWTDDKVSSTVERTNIDKSGRYCKKCNSWQGQLGLEPKIELYVDHLCQIYDQIYTLLKPEGSIWVNLGDTYMGTGGPMTPNMIKNKKKYRNGNSDEIYKVGKKDSSLPKKCLALVPYRFAIEMMNRGWILRNEVIWHKRSVLPFSGKDRMSVDFEPIFHFVKQSKGYYYNQPKEPTVDNPFVKKTKECVWSVSPSTYSGGHFATYSEELVKIPLEATCPEGGIVLDPFMGSGTTAMVAKKMGRNYLGCDISQAFINQAEENISKTSLAKTVDDFSLV